MERKSRQGRWRRYASDPAIRQAAVLAMVFAVPAAVAEKHVLPAVADAAVAIWRGLGPLGVLGLVVGLVWLADVCVWGLENATKDRGTRNPFWVLAYGLGGWLIVLIEMIVIPMARLAEFCSDAWQARRVMKRRLPPKAQLGQAA